MTDRGPRWIGYDKVAFEAIKGRPATPEEEEALYGSEFYKRLQRIVDEGNTVVSGEPSPGNVTVFSDGTYRWKQ